MKYLVMECHMAYVVVLDEDGRFLKAANMDYATGQTLDSIIEIVEPGLEFSEGDPSSSYNNRNFSHTGSRKKNWLPGFIKSALPVAAVVCLLLSSGHYLLMSPYGTIRLSINPEVEISVSRLNRVLSLSGINQDGQNLIQGYEYKYKKAVDVCVDLAERAEEMEYLSSGGTVYVSTSSAHENWAKEMKSNLIWELNDRLGSDIRISSGLRDETHKTYDEDDDLDDWDEHEDWDENHDKNQDWDDDDD